MILMGTDMSSSPFFGYCNLIHLNDLYIEQDKTLEISQVNVINIQDHMFLRYWTQNDKASEQSLLI